jgi:putative peptide maturation dehydrogenase
VPWVRRTRHLVFATPGDDAATALPVLSLLTGGRAALSLDEVYVLMGLSTRRWAWRVDDEAISLASRGFLVSDEPAEPFARLRRRDEELTALGWHPAAAAFLAGTRWDGTRVTARRRDGSRPPRPRRVGPPQPPFHLREGARVTLPAVAHEGELSRLLQLRRTTRSFDPSRKVTEFELATLLHSVWGAHGSAPLAHGDVAIRKTSPSGGGLHPVEVYPFVRNVDGVEPGIYHYRSGDHELVRLKALSGHACLELLERATAGQWYFADADVAFVMTARFARSFWKYRHHAKILRAILLEAGHLSQTFYLVCTQLGLGPYITAAVDDAELERALELDPLFEAPVAVCGCGRARAQRSPLEPEFRPL